MNVNLCGKGKNESQDASVTTLSNDGAINGDTILISGYFMESSSGAGRSDCMRFSIGDEFRKPGVQVPVYSYQQIVFCQVLRSDPFYSLAASNIAIIFSHGTSAKML